MKIVIKINLIIGLLIHLNLALGQNLVVSGGALHSAMLCGSGSVYVTGDNGNGQLGNGSLVPTYSTSFVQVLKGAGPSTDGTHLGKIRQIDARSTNHTIALACDSTVYVWGMNTNGQVGNGSTAAAVSSPTEVLTGAQGDASGFLKHVIQICGGNASSYALLKTGEVMAWGDNSNGELGDGTTTQRTSPVYVTKSGGGHLTNVIQIRAGDNYCAALCSDGTVWTWGKNSNGQLGQNNTTNLSVATQVYLDAARTQPLTGITKIATGDTHILALTSSGTLYTWGGNWSGQLGVNTGGANAVLPLQVVTSSGGSALTGVISISAGNQHSIAVCSNGNVYAWGGTANYQGQDGLASVQSYPTTAVSGIANATDVSAGDLWSFVQTSTGSVYAFGQNATTGAGATYGFLGLGTTTTSYSTPQLITLPCAVGRACPKANLGPNITICNPMSANLSAGSSNSNYVYLWKLNGDTIQSATSYTYTAVSAGTYTVIISDPTNPSPCGCTPDSSTMTITSTSNAVAINPKYCTLPATLNFCVSGPAGSNYDWYNASTGGAKLNTTPSNCYSTTVSSVPYIVYAQDNSLYYYATGYSYGASVFGATSASSDYYTNNTVPTYFDVLSPLYIDSATVRVTGGSAGSWTFTVGVYNSSNVLQGSSVVMTVSGTGTMTVIVPLGGIYLTAGTGYYLKVSASSSNPNFYTYHMANTANIYPDGVTSVISMQPPPIGAYASQYYGAFYDLKIKAGNNCSRVPVQADYSCTLPIELISFKGDAYSSYNQLTWTTASEKNNDHFLILKSNDGVNFYTIGKVSGHGTSNLVSNYSYKDEDPGEDMTYYKLQQIDIDGRWTESRIIEVDHSSDFGIKIFPNPFDRTTNIYVRTPKQEEISGTITDITGRLLNTTTFISNEEITIGEELPNGVYFVQIIYEQKIETIKIIKSSN